MRSFFVKFSILLLLMFFVQNHAFSQTLTLRGSKETTLKTKSNYFNKTRTADNAYLFIGALVILAATPTVVIENKKVYFGLSRELSLVFGKTGEFRVSAEYSFIFRRNLKHQFRAMLKYDILSELHRGSWIDDRSYYSFGAGYFADEEGIGVPAEISAGYRIGEDTYYLYPYAKLRHTFMTRKIKPDNTDISVGLAIGYQPF